MKANIVLDIILKSTENVLVLDFKKQRQMRTETCNMIQM